MKRYLRYAFWRLIYAFRPLPKTLEGHMKCLERTWSPWRRFRPFLYRNDAGHMWEVYLSDKREYSTTVTMTIEAGISIATGEVVSLQLWDEELWRVAQEQKARFSHTVES